MDRNTVVGLVVIFLILIGFSYFNRPSQEEMEEARRKRDSIAMVEARQDKLQEELQREAQQKDAKDAEKDSNIDPELSDEDETAKQTGAFSHVQKGEKRLVTLENDLLKINVSTQGGSIYSVEVKDYETYSGEPLVLYANDSNVFGLQFWGENKEVSTHKLFFEPDRQESNIRVKPGDNPETLRMRLAAGEESYIDYIYTIHPESYMIDFSMELSNMNDIISGRPGSIDLLWDVLLPQLEKNAEKESEYTTISYQLANGDFEELSSRTDEASEDIPTRISWVGYKQQFFSTFLVHDESFLNAKFNSNVVADGKHTREFSSRIGLPYSGEQTEEQNMKMYFGPNHFNTLKKYDHGFEEVVPLGGWIIKWINQYVIIFVFDLLNNFINSYGLIILLLTILIKIVLFPLTYKSYLSQAKMRVLKPQIDEIGKKYPKKEDAMKKQQAVMGLYKKVGVSPLGGCLPMLIQFPILIAMFRFFPASFELRQESFLWAEDLSTYDSILDLPFSIPFYGDHVSLFTLLMAGALFLTSKTSTAQMGDTSAQMPGMKYMMLYMMPLMLLFFFNSYSAGLSYYYFLSNIITFGQTMLIRKTVDDEAILKKLTENAKKPQKKSKFQAKIEEMAKQKQQQKRGKR